MFPNSLSCPSLKIFFPALRAIIACALSQHGIVNTCPFQVQSFMYRIMLDTGKLGPAMFPCSSQLVLRDGEHQPESYVYD